MIVKRLAAMIRDIDAKALFSDKANDVSDLIETALAGVMKVVIPPKKKRTLHREFDKELYKLRHLVKNAFMNLKRYRACHTKNLKSFLAAVQTKSH